MDQLLPSSNIMQEVARSSPCINKPTTTSVVPNLHICLALIASVTPQDMVAFSHAALLSPALSHWSLHRQKRCCTGCLAWLLHPYTGIYHTWWPLSKATWTKCTRIPDVMRLAKPHYIPDSAKASDHIIKCFSHSDIGNPTTYYCYTAVISPQRTDQVHLEQTSKFPVALCTGNSYLLLVHDYDSNGILAKPMPKRTGLCILHAYRTIHT
jgi:hypothetical protein